MELHKLATSFPAHMNHHCQSIQRRSKTSTKVNFNLPYNNWTSDSPKFLMQLKYVWLWILSYKATLNLDARLSLEQNVFIGNSYITKGVFPIPKIPQAHWAVLCKLSIVRQWFYIITSWARRASIIFWCKSILGFGKNIIIIDVVI